LVPDARPYYQSRVAVWKSARELIYVAGDDSTRLLDLASGEERELLPRPRSGFGLLVDATLSHATSGRPSFAVYHASDRTLSQRGAMPACEPYFSADGRFGYWMAGTGGPVRKMNLADMTSTVLFPRDSPLLPKHHGYVYYPMISSDQRLFAFG